MEKRRQDTKTCFAIIMPASLQALNDDIFIIRIDRTLDTNENDKVWEILVKG